jgi:DDE_Tnp_1-associated
VLYPLDEILLLVLLAVMTDCDGWVEVARFGEKRLALLRRFHPFKDGTPSHDQLGAIFAALVSCHRPRMALRAILLLRTT